MSVWPHPQGMRDVFRFERFLSKPPAVLKVIGLRSSTSASPTALRYQIEPPRRLLECHVAVFPSRVEPNAQRALIRRLREKR